MACRARRDKAQLLRVVRRPDGSVVLDPDGSLDGRGAYLCADASCWQRAVQQAALQRALRTSLPTELRIRLERADVATVGATPVRGASTSILGGTHGT